MLVLRRFDIDENASHGSYLSIAGRASGLTAWFLTTMKLDTETTLEVSETEVVFNSASLSGEVYHFVPIAHISSTHCGYSKPISYLIVGVVFIVVSLLLLSLVGMFLIEEGTLLLLIGVVFLVMYYLKKSMFVSVETEGGTKIRLAFKRSAIENVALDIDRVKEGIALLNDQIRKQSE